MKRHVLFVLCLAGLISCLWAGEDEDIVTTDGFRIDVRTTMGGRMLHGTEKISSVAENETSGAKLTVDQKTAAGWTVANPSYNSTTVADGWHDFTLKEGTDSFDARMLIINTSDIVIHEGVLKGDETWTKDKLHIVRHWVRVPENITLTIAPQAVVKFCEDTGIQVDGTLNADGAVFTVIADNTIGREVDLDGASFSLGFTTYQIIGDGAISMDGCDNRFEAKEGDAEVTVDTGTFRFDVRTSIGGRMLHGTEKISSVAENETTGAKLTVDQKTAAGWTVANPSYNSTKVADGWHDFALKEGSASFDARLLIINASDIVIHEGTLSQNETWATDKLHIVRHWVRVPENITLTIAPQAVVKFCEDTGIQVDGTLNADGAVFTVIADNTIGREVDLDGASFSLGFTTYQIIGDGAISMDGCDNRYESKAGADEVIVATATFRFDVRTSVGGRMLVGDEYISPVATEENGNAKLTVDGANAAGWSVDSPRIDSTRLTNDRWHIFALNEGNGTFEVELLPMNRNDVVVHEGVLAKNETWTADKLHIVRHWVRVPRDVTLTIKPKAVVKFCEDTGILVDEGGKLVGGAKAVFTSVMDDSDGDDTDVNGRSAAMGYGFYEIIGNTEDVQLSDCIKRGLASLIEDTVWEDVVHVLGTLKVPSGVTLTIKPRAVVKFATGASLVDDGGVISAEGALFTHLADDSDEAGGDTNGDGDATAPVHDAYTLPEGFEPNSEGMDDNGNEIRYITPQPFDGGTIAAGDTKILSGNRVHKVTGDIIVNGTLRVMPGAIVKMDTGHSIIVQTGGVLEAIGNRAQPIVFTSIMDDAHGGDADKEDNTAQPGDWGTLLLKGGKGEFEYCSFLYAGGVAGNQYNASANVFLWDNGSGTFKNCIFAHSTADGCFARESVFENCIFADCDRGLVSFNSLVSARNCIFFDNAHGAVGHGGTMNITNGIFYKNQEADVSNYGSTPNVSYSCAYSLDMRTIRNDYTRIPVTADVNGNICKDPLFTDPENGDFTLKVGSPCIDAGDGTAAPAMDYWGSPRMNVAKIADSGVPNADGVCPDIGIYEMPGVGGGAMPDLSVSDVAFESKAYRQGDVMTVTWSDVNAGDAAAVGPWRDVVSLVRKEEQVTYVVEGDTVTVPATLKSGRTQSLSTRFRLPALLPGEWQVQVAANQYRDVFEGEGGESNIVLSEETFTVEMDGIPVGKTTLSIDGDESKTVMLAGGATAGAVLRLTVANGADISVTASAGRIPTEDDFHWRGVQVSDGQWIVEIPKGTAGDVFVTVANNGDSSANVSAQRSAASATIFGTDVSEVANGGMASVVIYGAGLDKAAAAELGTVPATNIHVLSSMELVASFDLTNMAIGDYQLTVTLEGGRVLTMDGAIAVSQSAVGPKLMAGFSMPETLRPGRWYSGTITYRNDGDRDAIAPLLYLTGHDVTFLDTDDGFTEHAGHIVLAGLASDGDPSVI
ncbi:MAG: right-handed parallel beta-helix repeat-containing protein, partial [Victivallales bacterium]|nr:right-handed parallel beta-helix repeat-containing protein [Victivallales bacterium]